MKIFLSFCFALFTIIVIQFVTKNNAFTDWSIINNSKNKDSISWASFKWIGEDLNGKYYDRVAMFIPCKVDGISNIVTFQFDLGADLTGVYEKNLSSFYVQNPNLKNRIIQTSKKNQFWKKISCFKNLKIDFDSYTLQTDKSFLYSNYGEYVRNIRLEDTIHIGTIGADVFKNKLLIIDYPNQKFAITDNLPKSYNKGIEWINISLDNKNRVILPMELNNENYEVLFDNGSSLFPLITQAENINLFTREPYIDTIQVSSWGKLHDVTGCLIKDKFSLGGQSFSNVMIYANHTGNGINKKTDAMAGNALFWNKAIIIDYKNKRFGVK